MRGQADGDAACSRCATSACRGRRILGAADTFAAALGVRVLQD
jgi:hypothetical protein